VKGRPLPVPASTPLANIADLPAPLTDRAATRLDRVARLGVQAVLLLGPTVLAFRAGGYFDGPRTVAAVTAWALVAVSAVAFERPLPSAAPSRIAVAALAGLCLWVGLGASWAPLAGPAQDDLMRNLLYLTALLLAVTAWRSRAELRRVEPLLAVGVLIVVGYGLAGRLVPDLLDQAVSASAQGRLDQPLTYWNAMGALAAIGLVLSARLCGDETRPAYMRLAAAAAAAPLGAGLYISFSRGAIAALLVGLVVLIALLPAPSQLRATAVVFVAAFLAAFAASVLPGVNALEGDATGLRRDGLVMLAVLLAAGSAAALAARRLVVPAEGRPARRPHPAVVAAVVAILVGAPMLVALLDDSGDPARPGAGVQRLGDVGSNRYDYWEVALDEFAEAPFKGGGPGSFEVAWRRDRDIEESVGDAHSLPIETAAELGLVGLVLLALLVGAVDVGARRAWIADPGLAAGPIAALATWALHACLDWDWEMPALTLVALVLAGALLAAGGELSPRRAD
jgi:hypothetical protein